MRLPRRLWADNLAECNFSNVLQNSNRNSNVGRVIAFLIRLDRHFFPILALIGKSQPSSIRISTSGKHRLASNMLNAVLCSIVFGLLCSPVLSASFLDAERLYNKGQYRECLAMCLSEFERGVWNDRWPQKAIECLLTTGRYEEAQAVYEAAKKRFSTSIGIRILGQKVCHFNGNEEQANVEVDNVMRMLRSSPWRYTSSADLVRLGRYFVSRGEDARQVLELFYDRVRKANPKYAEVYIASAELALEKHDHKLAAEMLETASKLTSTDPRIPYLLSRAYSDSDSQKATKFLRQALEMNPRHVDSLLLAVDNQIDAENYSTAEEILTEALAVNLFHPNAWAYHAVIAHLKGHFEGESVLRDLALSNWSTNPHVDHLIGLKLSRKYRFAEAAEYQRNALQLRADFLPAKFQLAQDFLRLGKDAEGWEMAHQVRAEDEYNVVAFNLVSLHDRMKNYATLENDAFILRMDQRESRIYGDDALQLLQTAYDVLCEKYDVEIDGKVVVEIFPQQKDFAIRTFGLPGGAGYLGVCFGRVITANSPASQGTTPSNWHSVLWHEFCHVVTLEKTKNKMPRWLSEGISVYEERQRDTTWGEHLTLQYRDMILAGQLTPVSELSSAFLQPESPTHLQFAYYQSSMVVEYLIDNYGFETLLRVLDDLAIGIDANTSLQRYVGSMKELEDGFDVFAKKLANDMAPKLSFAKPKNPGENRELPLRIPLDPSRIRSNDETTDETVEEDSEPKESSDEPTSLVEFSDDRPNYFELHRQADRLIATANLDRAKELLEETVSLFPNDRSGNSALVKLSSVHKRMQNNDEERDALRAIADLESDALDIFKRLIESEANIENWEAVMKTATRYLAVQPLQPTPHEWIVRAGTELDRPKVVADALKALMEMNPLDPAKAHFDLAKVYWDIGQAEQAKRQVLMALEFAPRYRAAQKLLLEIAKPNEAINEITEQQGR